MDVKKMIGFMEKQIEGLEQATYMFENVVRPRYERDKAILEEMRQQYLKLQVLKEKFDAGVEVSQEEMQNLVPQSFR